MSTVVVVGLGYVGLPLAMRASAVGHQVAGYDLDEARVACCSRLSPTSRTCRLAS